MARITLLSFLGALALGGCGAHRPVSRPRSPVTRAQSAHEYPSPPGPPQHASRALSSPREAVAAFAGAYINWGFDTVSADMRQLAARSIGQARAAAELASAETAADYELKRDGIANGGTVEAIAPMPGHADRYLVVTREWTTATGTTAYQGLQPAWHVTVATVSQLGRGEWVVSGWQPES
jgi:hypothetical protein